MEEFLLGYFCGFLQIYGNGLFNLNTADRTASKDSFLLYREPVVRNEMEVFLLGRFFRYTETDCLT